MNKEQAILEAGRVWQANMADVNALKKRIRAEAEAQIEREVKARREAAARAIRFAFDQGATKTALRSVTTKDHWDFESYLELGEELAHAGGEAEEG
jgi:N-acetylmuramic acid 6-phosphate (MurNAc-6-P) etherase